MHLKKLGFKHLHLPRKACAESGTTLCAFMELFALRESLLIKNPVELESVAPDKHIFLGLGSFSTKVKI